MADSALDVAVEAVRDRADLVRISVQWDDLARHSVDPDAVHETALTLALLNAAGACALQCCLSWGRDPERSDLPATLGGLFPLRRGRGSWGFPSWIVQAPLVRAEDAQRHLAALLDWLERAGATLVEFRHLPREGRLSEVLADVLRERDSAVHGRDVPALDDVDGPGLRNLVIGLRPWGEMLVSMLPLLERAKRRIALRVQSRTVAA